jgi:hypothetical protein
MAGILAERNALDKRPVDYLVRPIDGQMAKQIWPYPVLEDPRASVAASNSLLDRGYGKPVAPIEMDHHVGEFDHLSDDQLEAKMKEKLAELGIKFEPDRE